jgi:hypothetical protein
MLACHEFQRPIARHLSLSMAVRMRADVGLQFRTGRDTHPGGIRDAHELAGPSLAGETWCTMPT